ncbi:hypothetical protein [uncultured Lacinutrix sp.]|uniref:hypothetical protein n=1 Tax=uncultured Lacinutrix sp. TaxID=574032 RepID=UPI0026131B5B|nr:hypothetical protein [uncultured Lacinutrix sp.]
MKITTLVLILSLTTMGFAQHETHNNDDGRIIKIPVVLHIVNKKANEIIEQLNTNYAAKNDMSLADTQYKTLAGNYKCY